MSGWKMTAATAAASDERASTMIAGSRFMMRTAVMAGTTITHGVIRNVLLRVEEYTPISPSGTPPCVNPSMAKTINVMVKEGTVVMYM